VELDGGFKCDCLDGYELRDDGTACEGVILQLYDNAFPQFILTCV